MKEASIAVAAANKCQRISVSYANILPGWKRTHFTAINVVFVGKLLQIGVPIITYNQSRFIKNKTFVSSSQIIQAIFKGLKG